MRSIAGLADRCAYGGSRDECEDDIFLVERVDEVRLLSVGLL
jgi:hypothetical protein